jgi:aryl-alcohol dehydrogenase-like predicted oxidoreductase
MNNRIGMGTVQFGLPYGIANKGSCVSYNEASSIMLYAREHGLKTLDTAISYGESEKRLGEMGVNGWSIVSKLPDVPVSCVDIAAWVSESVIASLQRLKVNRLYGLLLHRTTQLLGIKGDIIYAALLELKKQGLVEKIGVSIYGVDELEVLCPRYTFDLIQAPLNIIDRRIVASGWLAHLKKKGVEVHVRSVFLQGLLLKTISDRPTYFSRWQHLWQNWHNWLDEEQVTPLQACLGYVLSHAEIERVLIGVHTLNQLQEILMTKELVSLPPGVLMNDDLDLINPFNWSLARS